MANLLSSKKRIKQNVKRQERNRARKSELKSATRKIMDTIHQGDLQSAQDQFQSITKMLDQIASKGTLHRNNASRNKSRLAKRINVAMAEKSK